MTSKHHHYSQWAVHLLTALLLKTFSPGKEVRSLIEIGNIDAGPGTVRSRLSMTSSSATLSIRRQAQLERADSLNTGT
jgi:hypothetical protein